MAPLGVSEFLLVKDENGFWRIREQRERERIFRVDSMSWGRVKAVYR